MKEKDPNKSFSQRMAKVDVLGDGNLYTVNPSDVLIKTFEKYGNQENNDQENTQEKK